MNDMTMNSSTARGWYTFKSIQNRCGLWLWIQLLFYSCPWSRRLSRPSIMPSPLAGGVSQMVQAACPMACGISSYLLSHHSPRGCNAMYRSPCTYHNESSPAGCDVLVSVSEALVIDSSHFSGAAGGKQITFARHARNTPQGSRQGSIVIRTPCGDEGFELSTRPAV